MKTISKLLLTLSLTYSILSVHASSINTKGSDWHSNLVRENSERYLEREEKINKAFQDSKERFTKEIQNFDLFNDLDITFQEESPVTFGVRYESKLQIKAQNLAGLTTTILFHGLLLTSSIYITAPIIASEAIIIAAILTGDFRPFHDYLRLNLTHQGRNFSLYCKYKGRLEFNKNIKSKVKSCRYQKEDSDTIYQLPYPITVLRDLISTTTDREISRDGHFDDTLSFGIVSDDDQDPSLSILWSEDIPLIE